MKEKYRLPDYFRQKYQLIATVTFTAFFSLVFMLVSIPFSHNVWFELGGVSFHGGFLCDRVVHHYPQQEINVCHP